jgi:hypothetical protein
MRWLSQHLDSVPIANKDVWRLLCESKHPSLYQMNEREHGIVIGLTALVNNDRNASFAFVKRDSDRVGVAIKER